MHFVAGVVHSVDKDIDEVMAPYCDDIAFIPEEDILYDDYGYAYNPKARYDWYEVGGRWGGFLINKENGTETNAGIVNTVKFGTWEDNLPAYPYAFYVNGMWYDESNYPSAEFSSWDACCDWLWSGINSEHPNDMITIVDYHI